MFPCACGAGFIARQSEVVELNGIQREPRRAPQPREGPRHRPPWSSSPLLAAELPHHGGTLARSTRPWLEATSNYPPEATCRPHSRPLRRSDIQVPAPARRDSAADLTAPCVARARVVPEERDEQNAKWGVLDPPPPPSSPNGGVTWRPGTAQAAPTQRLQGNLPPHRQQYGRRGRR